ncbi:MAG TPA: class I SAM-dependent methyltransferase [Actinomycetota bacterium]|nr:class I SAM-dependent methyltransferase [Actinomycetota bacterium]
MDIDHLIEEQIDYYRNRAVEYDETSRPVYDSLARYWNELVAALDRFQPRGEVLEIASGTGTWTAELLRHAAHVTALDSSSEMHEQARAKLDDDPRVRFVHADVFSWKPDSQCDVVFFANWLSHVPPRRFDNFWQTVGSALRPAGRVFFIDELRDAWREDVVAAGETPVVHRSLRDGRRFRVVKVFRAPRDVESRFLQLGWQAHVHPTGPFFWADGRQAS